MKLRAAQAGSVALQQPAPQPAGGKGFAQTRMDGDTSAVKVTLQDCLACSGCVTSAETVLLEHQSIAELRSKLQVRQSPSPALTDLHIPAAAIGSPGAPEHRRAALQAAGLHPLLLCVSLCVFL